MCFILSMEMDRVRVVRELHNLWSLATLRKCAFSKLTFNTNSTSLMSCVFSMNILCLAVNHCINVLLMSCDTCGQETITANTRTLIGFDCYLSVARPPITNDDRFFMIPFVTALDCSLHPATSFTI